MEKPSPRPSGRFRKARSSGMSSAPKSSTSVRVLRLGFGKTTDAGLVQLNDLTALTHLDLSGTPVTDAGMAQLKGLKNLSRLGLGYTQVTDAGEKELGRLCQV